MVIEKNRIVVIGKDTVRFVDAGHALIEQPLRCSGFIFRHDPDGERLALSLGLFDDPIDERKVILALRWFEFGPRPAEIGDGRMGIFFDGGRMPEPKVKISKAHAGVVQHVVDLMGVHSRFRRRAL